MAEHVARYATFALEGIVLVASGATVSSRQACPTPRHPVRVLAFHGTADPLVPYGGGPIGPMRRLAARRRGSARWATGAGARARRTHRSGLRGLGAAGLDPGDGAASVRGRPSGRPDALAQSPRVANDAVPGTRRGPYVAGGAPYLPARIIGPVARHLDATGILLDFVVRTNRLTTASPRSASGTHHYGAGHGRTDAGPVRRARQSDERHRAEPLHRGMGEPSRRRCRQRPRAVLCISAHWYTNATAVTAMAHPRTIHDFFGFPDELFAVAYPCPGSREVAAEVADVVKPRWVGLDADSWGIDHGTWSVLTHMYPDADVPVVQFAINALEPLDSHLDLGRRLAPAAREKGVLIVTSGNVVHNLRRPRLEPTRRRVRLGGPLRRGGPRGRRRRASRRREAHTASGLPAGRADSRSLHPVGLLRGVAAEAGTQPEVVVEGYNYGALSMTCYRVA